MAGAGDATKGAEALKGVSIPMFSAKGLAIKRSNGEVVTPFYFAYEDLREDWSKLVEQADAMDGVDEGVKGKMTKKLAAKPKVNRSFSTFSFRIFLLNSCATPSLIPFLFPFLPVFLFD